MDLQEQRKAVGLGRSRADLIFDIFNMVLMAAIVVVIIYPLYFVLVASVSDPMAVHRGETFLRPVDVNFIGYQEIMKTRSIWAGYRNTVFYTLGGTVINIALTLTCAYALTKKDMPFRKLLSALIIFTMLFDGGMIPRYMIVRNIGIYDTVWAVILPRAVWVFCLMVARTFIEQTIPYDLYEAASVEGCSFARYFTLTIIPLSPALISILVLYYGVGHWNSYFDAMIYMQTRELYPLQLILREILITNLNQSATVGGADSAEAINEMLRKSESLKYAIVIVSSLPVLMLYPFLQRYFVKGIMIGAIKG